MLTILIPLSRSFGPRRRLRICLTRLMLLTVGGIASLGTSAKGEDTAPRPNIVYFLADDLGAADVGWRGSEIKTPHLDRLAKNGAQLEQFYAQPLCTPTRAALLTGRYPFRYGLQMGVISPWADYGLPLEERLLPQALKSVGYETAIVGKWHLGIVNRDYLPTRRGFDHQYGLYNGAVNYFTHVMNGGFDWHKNDQVNHDEGYSTHLIAKEAVRIVQERDREKPLFLYVPFNAVHGPLDVPKNYSEPYSHFRKQRQTYAGMLAAMDEAVGQIVAAVEAQGELENTLFLFSSDNGGVNPGEVSDNGPLRAGKATVYEGGVRVCAFAFWQGKIQPGTVVNEPLHVVDWYPTLLKLAGASLEQPLPLDGKDVWPTITQGAPSPHEEIILNIGPNGGAIRVGDWKLVKSSGNKPRDGEARQPGFELFNLREDSGEKNDLAENQPSKLEELQSRYQELEKQAVPAKRSGPKPDNFQPPRVWGE
ncbi:arylsulfatase B [Planctomicrobium sp. SH661]|uniref:arylsulfatase B n=1 Tax=Planctomicrobium sp. SH661 TaxID=3448124 RepID=UPI003F5BE5C8